MTVTERQTVIATKDKDGNTVMLFPVTSAKYVEGAVRTVNGIEPDANGDVVVAGLPVGHIYFSLEKTVPTGSLPLNGGTYAHLAYIDLWNYILEKGNYLTFDEWQAMYDANDGNVPFYAITRSGNQSQWRFRVPSINGWVKGASSLEDVGSYLEAGLPNITGEYNTNFRLNYDGDSTASGAFYDRHEGSVSSWSSSGSDKKVIIGFDASQSNSIYGNSDTVQPPSIVGIWLVKAFSTVSNVGNQDIAEVSAGLTRVENQMTEYTENVSYIDSFVVETWESTDGTAWYRKYNDGRIEQGGRLFWTASRNPGVKPVTFYTPMVTRDYSIFITPTATEGGTYGFSATNITETGCSVFVYGHSSDDKEMNGASWHVIGR